MQIQAGTLQQYTHVIAHMESALKDNKMSSIRNLLNAGKRLTGDEKEYLRKHDHELYQQAMAIEEEQRSFKRAMERCKTKDEVNNLYFAKTGLLADEATRAFKSSGSATSGKSKIQYISALAAAIREAYLDFKAEGKP